ncbi:MAG: hypothetical protein ACR2MO_14640 [Acidimicrobiales bacterium]
MTAAQLELRVALSPGWLDDDAVAECASMLGEELAELDVDTVEPATGGEAPAGTKGVELVALGALVVKLVRSRALLGQVVEAVRDWASRNDAGSVRLEIGGDVIEIKGASQAERDTLIDAWVRRHAEP